MTVNLTNMLSTIALIGLLVGPTVGVADGSDAYQACQDMKWKADKQAKKNCFRDLALSYEVVMANGSTDTDTSELEDEIAELEGKLEESEEGIAEIEEAHEAEIAELEAKLEESSTDTDTSDLEDEVAELEGKLEESEAEIAELEANVVVKARAIAKHEVTIEDLESQVLYLSTFEALSNDLYMRLEEQEQAISQRVEEAFDEGYFSGSTDLSGGDEMSTLIANQLLAGDFDVVYAFCKDAVFAAEIFSPLVMACYHKRYR